MRTRTRMHLPKGLKPNIAIIRTRTVTPPRKAVGTDICTDTITAGTGQPAFWF